MSTTLLALLFAGLFAHALAPFLRRKAARLAQVLAAVFFGLGLLLVLLPSLSSLG